MRYVSLVLLLVLCCTLVDSIQQLRGGKDQQLLERKEHAGPVAKRTTSTINILRKAQKAAFKGGFYAASAGAVQVLSLMWLRTTVNYQYRYGVSMIAAIQQLYTQGGITRFYQGLPFALLIGPISKFGAVAANEWSNVIVASFALSSGAAQLYATILGTLLTVAWRIFLMPIETCKTVLQVDGAIGFEKLTKSVLNGHFGVLYRGSSAAILSIAAGHYPWFMMYNLLDKFLHKSDELLASLGRSALIGFAASAVSDTVSNFLRVLKTMKQATGADGRRALSYYQIAHSIVQEDGWTALLGRGLLTRLVSNGVQSVLFTVLLQALPLLWNSYYYNSSSSNHNTDNNHIDDDSVSITKNDSVNIN